MKLHWSRAVMAAAGIAFALSAVAGNAASPAPSGVPGKPSSLKATAGDTQVKLTWLAPAPGLAPIDYYVVTRSPGTPSAYQTPDSTPSFAVTNLTNGILYTFRVAAHNALGTGAASLAATATPRVIPPGRPTNLGATQTGPGQIRLDWTPPTTNGSMPDGSVADITRYNITVKPGGTSTQVPASTLTYSISGLADNLTYTFSVSATNTRPTTGAAAVVYAPVPTGASIGLNPTAGRSTTAITVTGQLFLKNQSITLYWDLGTHVAATVVADDTGAFTKVVKPRKGDVPKVHRLCANVLPKPACASFTLQAAPPPTTPSPSPSDFPSPSPTDTPQASGVRPGGGGISGLEIITRPPFVFLPIIAIIGILGVLLYWLLSRRRQMSAAPAATVVHRATRPDYMAPFPTSGAAPAAPPPPAQPSAWDAPIQSAPPVQPYVPPAVEPPPPAAPYTPTPYVPPPVPPQAPPPPAPPAAPPRKVEWPASPNPPAAPDEPPDLPQPSD
jgi:hypothetical protein